MADWPRGANRRLVGGCFVEAILIAANEDETGTLLDLNCVKETLLQSLGCSVRVYIAAAGRADEVQHVVNDSSGIHSADGRNKVRHHKFTYRVSNAR